MGGGSDKKISIMGLCVMKGYVMCAKQSQGYVICISYLFLMLHPVLLEQHVLPTKVCFCPSRL